MAITSSLSELNILLVEPSTMQANLVRRMLEKLGAGRITHCPNGAAALEQLGGIRQPVVISSLYLPDMSGIELVAALRHNPATEATPFILVSSETRPQVLDPVRQSGACSIVTKPFTEQQLARAVFAAADYLNPPADLDTADFERLRVLLVDDSNMSRRHLKRLLGELGVERVTEAVNGIDAVHRLQETMVDLVITDYNMPEMDGQQLTEYIRTQSWQNNVPVLMVTSEQNQGRLAAVEKAGVSLVCDKPFDATTIRLLICEAMSR
mgnify:CR=1 FL=1